MVADKLFHNSNGNGPTDQEAAKMAGQCTVLCTPAGQTRNANKIRDGIMASNLIANGNRSMISGMQADEN